MIGIKKQKKKEIKYKVLIIDKNFQYDVLNYKRI